MMDEIKTVIDSFSHSLERAIQNEVRRQMLEQLDTAMKQQAMPVVEDKPAPRRGGPPVGTKAQPKPCPTCGVLNTARRFRFYCAEHRTS